MKLILLERTTTEKDELIRVANGAGDVTDRESISDKDPIDSTRQRQKTLHLKRLRWDVDVADVDKEWW